MPASRVVEILVSMAMTSTSSMDPTKTKWLSKASNTSVITSRTIASIPTSPSSKAVSEFNLNVPR